jgi:hypothetical protein
MQVHVNKHTYLITVLLSPKALPIWSVHILCAGRGVLGAAQPAAGR